MNSISKNNVILILLSTLLRFIKSLLVTKNYIYYIVIFYTYELYFLVYFTCRLILFSTHTQICIKLITRRIAS